MEEMRDWAMVSIHTMSTAAVTDVLRFRRMKKSIWLTHLPLQSLHTILSSISLCVYQIY